MSITVDLGFDVENQLTQAATEQGQSLSEYLRNLIEPPKRVTTAERRKTKFVQKKSHSELADAEQARIAAINDAMGSLKQCPGTVDDFIRDKRRDVELEARHNWPL